MDSMAWRALPISRGAQVALLCRTPVRGRTPRSVSLLPAPPQSPTSHSAEAAALVGASRSFLAAPSPRARRGAHALLAHVRRAHKGEDAPPPESYMHAVEDEIEQRPEDMPPPAAAAAAGTGGDAQHGGALDGALTHHSALTVGQAMTTDVLALPDGMPLLHAMRALLSRHVSGAPVVNEDGELVGVLSQSDVLRRCAAMPQEDAAAPPPWLPIWHALAEWRGRSSRAEDAAEDGTNADVDAEWLLDAPVQQAMTPDPIFVHPGALVSDAAALMARHSVNRLPVLDHGRLVGILARGDVLAAFAAAPANVDDSRGDANKEQRYDTPQAGECRDM